MSIILELEQKKILYSKYNKILANSCAGSGKTEIQVRKAINYVIKKNYNVLDITFTHSNRVNITDRVTKILDEKHINYDLNIKNSKTLFEINNKNIYVCTIDSCIDSFIKSYLSLSEYNNIKTDHELKYYKLQDWLNNNNDLPIPFNNYDAIIVDEWQDVSQSVLKMEIIVTICNRIKECLLIGDNLQEIYPPPILSNQMSVSSFNYTIENLDNVKEYKLLKNRRSSKQIIKFANSTTNQNMITDNTIRKKPLLITHGSVSNENECYKLAKYLVKIVNNWVLKEKIPLSEIIFIQRRSSLKSDNGTNLLYCYIEQQLLKYNLDCTWYNKDDKSLTFQSININDITLSSIAFSKGGGWECVIFLNCTYGSLPMFTNDNIHNALSTYNVGVTRAKKNLIITTNRYYPSPFLKEGLSYMDIIDLDNKQLGLFELDIEIPKQLKNNQLRDITTISNELSNLPNISNNILFDEYNIGNCKKQFVTQLIRDKYLDDIFGCMGQELLYRQLCLDLGITNFKSYFSHLTKYFNNYILCNNKNFIKFYYKNKLSLSKILEPFINDNIELLKNKWFEWFLHFSNYNLDKIGGIELIYSIIEQMTTKRKSIFKILYKKSDIDLYNELRLSINDFFLPKSNIDLLNYTPWTIGYLSSVMDGRKALTKKYQFSKYYFMNLINNIENISTFIINDSKIQIKDISNSLEFEKTMKYMINNIQISGRCDILINNNIYEIKCSSHNNIHNIWKNQTLQYTVSNNYKPVTIINCNNGKYYKMKMDIKTIDSVFNSIKDILLHFNL